MFRKRFFICVSSLVALTIVFVFLHGGHSKNTGSYNWEFFDVSDDWSYFDNILLTADIPFISVDELPADLSVTIKNSSSFEIEFLCESVSLQKMDETGRWLTWTSASNSTPAGAEIQKFLLHGESLTFTVKLSDLIPTKLLVAGNYRLYFPFTYRTSEDEHTYGTIDLSYGYAVSEIDIK